MQHNEFDNRLAVVTGASSGIGYALTTGLLQAGARVLAMSRHQGELGALQEHYGERLTWLEGDISRADDLARLARYAHTLGPIHYLAPNAGIAQLADGLDAAAFERQWAVNGAGALNTLASLKAHLARPASVVFTGTFLSQATFPGLAAYIASKAALKAFARNLAVELAADDIRVNMVSPGPTATPIWGTLQLSDDALAAVAKTVEQRLLNGAFLEPAMIADAMLHLLSLGARGIHGQDLIVDNGYTLR
ncbi:SDR family oxidoreductase [Pseudomonas aeruginosa]|uniref:Oxidoreductase n=4 Tax=Pseudomonadaceae TaxID=135621 RepID=U2ZBA3_AQUA1|nr:MULTISPECIES: SDR family oxidoreductase [Pseudomonadaceae]MBJ7546025.1 SDR family oxidoreductase [Pseudomonas sp. OA3]EKY0806579.1 SDR family oxidoreductase [Pseudomonas aeruginosa]MBG5702162.1 SDR family oxidoreductase [Pseudomonas aeruginosa]MCE0975414.1 SDR family oxidoreductase [Pseudomonas putida]MCS7561269.1 SDR family oxidoreductase [Pseudomonas aeruginosa]